jgi:bifunctional non-homologous end joining protein LigD
VKAAELLRLGFALVVGWTDPEGSRPYLGALLLAYHDPGGRVVSPAAPAPVSNRRRRLQPLATSQMPLAVPPPRNSRFGSPLVLSRVHWVRPELVAEVKDLTWTADNLLRQVVYEGLREDKPAAEVRREVPYPSPELSTIDWLARTQSRKG